MPPSAPATTSGQALQNLQTAQNSQQTPDQIAQSTDQSLGVNQAQQQVSGLRQAITNTTNLLNGVAPSVQGRTANSLVTSAQAEKQISNEQAPISQELSGQNTNLTNDTSDLNSLLSQASAEDTAKETAQSDTLTNLQNIYSDLYGQEQNAAQAAAAQQAAQAAAAQQNIVNQQNQEKIDQAGACISASTVNPATGYSVKQLSSGNKAYTGPNGQTNLYQYASALAGGDPTGTYDNILSQLSSGSPTDKGAYKVVQSMPMAQGIAYLQQHNGYIFN
jgi:hypothetical protein